MTISTQTIKNVNHHENFVKAIEPSEKQIALLAEFGYDEEFTKLFVNAANWIAVNDNKRRSMKFFKKNQPLVDAKVAEVFEEDGKTFMRFTAKADKIMSGRKNKINVSQEPRQKIKQSKGYTAKAEISEEIQQFLDKHNLVIRGAELTNSSYRVKVSNPDSSRKIILAIYEEKIKFRVYGKKREENYRHILDLIDMEIVENHKMSNSFGFVQIDKKDLDKVTTDMFL